VEVLGFSMQVVEASCMQLQPLRSHCVPFACRASRSEVIRSPVERDEQGNAARGGYQPTLLANAFLHYVFDLSVINGAGDTCGRVVVGRYADHFVMGFESEVNAQWNAAP
jgi:hypothetical protein